MVRMLGAPSDPARLAALADQCVMCGLCLPFCPTYAVGREEGESPRGRIALIKSLAEGRLTATPRVLEHLDSCLACRRCEAVCPANVQYGELIAGARAMTALEGKRPAWQRLLDRSLTRPRRLRALMAIRPALTLLRPWSRRRGGWAKRLRLLDALPWPGVPDSRQTAGRLPAHTCADNAPARRQILLFQGCVAGSYEARLRDGAMRLLAALGEDVAVADTGLCCGSIARFGGDADDANAREAELADSLRRSPDALVLGSATGCHARLGDVAARVGVATDELASFIADHPALPSLGFAALVARVAVHRPCSQRLLGTRSAAAVDRLLALIPGLVRVDLPEQDRCCGAAGSHFIARPSQSLKLRQRVLQDVATARPDIVVSANIGCRLGIQGGIIESGVGGRAAKIAVLHPVELLAGQLLP